MSYYIKQCGYCNKRTKVYLDGSGECTVCGKPMCKRHRQYYHICKECYSKQSPELQQKLKAAAKSYNLGGFLGVFIMIGGTIIAGILANLIFKATGVSLEWMVFVTIGVGIVVILVTSIKSTKRFQALLVDVVPKSST